MSIRQIAFTLLTLFGGLLSTYGQDVSIAINRDSLLIGEQLIATITAQAEPEATVLFPEGQTFNPIEVIKIRATDTLAQRPKLILEKSYVLSAFDPGDFKITPQQVTIDKRPYLTPELEIYIQDVAVDTTKQGLYGIKSLVKVNRPDRSLVYLIIALVVLAAAVLGYFIYKKLKKDPAAPLDPFEETQRLFESLRANTSAIEITQLYYRASVGFKRYISVRLGFSANERTSTELMLLVHQLNESERYGLAQEQLLGLEKTLERSDLAKFANWSVGIDEVHKDLDLFMGILTQLEEKKKAEIEEVVVQPVQQKSRRTKILIAIAVVILGLASFGVYGLQVGFENALDTVMLNSSKKMYEQEWVQSSYGFPPVTLESPEALIRQEGVFVYQHPSNNFKIVVKVLLDESQAELDFRAKSEEQLSAFEADGLTNIIPKGELFTTPNDIQGYRSYGTATNKENTLMHYEHLIFGGPKFAQEVVILGEAEDQWANKAIERILDSINVSTEL